MIFFGLKRWAGLFLCGAMSALGFAPIHASVLTLLAVAILAGILRKNTRWQEGARDGFWFGWGFFIAGNYWICLSLLVDLARFWWLIPFCLFGLTAALALFPAIAGAAVVRARFTPAYYPFGFACVWTAQEWLRGHLFTGFPWNLLGYAVPDIAAQTASLVGIYGLTFLVAWWAASLQRNHWRHAIAPTIVCLSLMLWGAVRLANAPEMNVQPTQNDIRLRIVQGNIPQQEKWNEGLRMQHLRTYAQLTTQEGWQTRTHIIWPESAVPFVWNEVGDLQSALQRLVPPHGALITGALRSTLDETGEQRTAMFNSIFALGSDGDASHYDKIHLVPFGEYVPLRAYLPIEKITPGTIDFTSGTGDQAFAIPGAPRVLPLLCYEAIFPALAQSDSGDDKPKWLMSVTNDAWFGTSSGPYQHFDMARFRAIEQGLPLVRAANTGISGVVDSYGRVIARLPLETQGVLDVTLPDALGGGTTYSSHGNAAIWMLIAFSGLYSLFINLSRRKT